MRRERIALGIAVASMAVLAAVTACKKKSCPNPAPCPPGPKVEGAVVVKGDQSQGLVLKNGDDVLLVPMAALPPGTRLCHGEKCDDVGGQALAIPALVPLRGCPCNLLQCQPLCRPSFEMPAARPAQSILAEKDGSYVITVDDGVAPPISLPVATDKAVLGDETVPVSDVLSGAKPSPLRPCPCTQQRCLPYCRIAGSAAAGSGSASPNP